MLRIASLALLLLISETSGIRLEARKDGSPAGGEPEARQDGPPAADRDPDLVEKAEKDAKMMLGAIDGFAKDGRTNGKIEWREIVAFFSAMAE